ncbi:helix-turn-helix transcriptional regulator [Pseudonocardia alaniniphila]|uniref:AAA family ATPase n=1 Tax=Pseudonocardia alaniniphila TaxID=75291 RepID=A0ABS9TTI6_9PSEU|nr:LuxR family transcriptional regulator [Pseudonocardia alaniniphila]MCH6171811.1 AAA family ATPase [Pseudonocardia alaniniphila]
MDLANLLGRRAEREAVEHLLTEARAGRSRVLVVRGEAGIGKTALLEHTAATATSSGFRVERACGVESETQFAFAGLHQLCAHLLDRAGALPEPQQAALGVALGLRSGTAPDRFLVGLATLNLLADVSEDRPLLCLLDDAQWLDQASAQVLAFVARRLVAERVGLVFALRDPDESDLPALTGLPELRLNGLGEADSRALLAGAARTTLDDEVRDRIIAEARGNPLALLELPRGAEHARLAGGFGRPDVLDVPRGVEDAFRRRSGGMPAETRLLLLVAAAEPTGDVALLWRAAGDLGIEHEAAGPAETAGLVEIDTVVRFRHPLVRSAVYRAATPTDRRRVHRALATATDPWSDPDRRAWHRAQAVSGVDEEVATELERSAGRARGRGGLAAAAAFLQQAAELSSEPTRRRRRALDGAHAKHEAGASEAASKLLAIAAAGSLDALQRARLELLRAQIAFHLTRGSEAPGMLLDAARTLAPLDATLARETYLHALDAAIITGPLRYGRGVPEVAEAAQAAPAAPGSPTPIDLLLDGLVTTYTQGYEVGVPGLRRALDAFDTDSRRSLWLAGRTAAALFDDEMVHKLAGRNVQLTREAGALAELPAALIFQSAALVLAGELAHAAELAAEETAITRATGAVPLRHARLLLAAWCGRRSEAAELFAASVQQATGREEGTEVTLAHYSMSVLYNGVGDYAAALDAATRASQSYELSHRNLALPELVEAAARAGQPERAAAALDELTSRARAGATHWALGLAARSQALTSTGITADEHYREAIDRLGSCRMATHLARTHLVYGEWLRRGGHRHDAREHLRIAHDMLSDMGAEAFAARAARELRATGEHPRRRTAQPADALTAQELHIARLVATGATSREVGAQLFLSPRTIEAHLRSIFRKLGITSRRQLKEIRLP